MRFLVVGNAPNCEDAVKKAAARSDVIIQINHCRYADLLPRVQHRARSNYVFVTNTGSGDPAIIDRLLTLKNAPVFDKMQVVLARNPLFYTVKKHLLHAKCNWHWCDYRLYTEWKRLREVWPVSTVSLLSAISLERKLWKLGMPRSMMPSSGMIAYDWIFRRLETWDYLFVEGFGFEGWERHPWAIEKRLIRTVVEERARLPQQQDALTA